jgi:hypothetical protein
MTSLRNIPLSLLFLVFCVLVLTSCFTNFRSSIRVTLKPTNDLSRKVLGIADTVAHQHGLTIDHRTENSEGSRGYFGNPYHYYTIEIKEISNGVVIVEYRHHARMASRSTQRREPEEAFLKALMNETGLQIIEVKTE